MDARNDANLDAKSVDIKKLIDFLQHNPFYIPPKEIERGLLSWLYNLIFNH